MSGVKFAISNVDEEAIRRFRMLSRITNQTQAEYLRRLVELHRRMLKSEDPRVQKLVFDVGLNKALVD